MSKLSEPAHFDPAMVTEVTKACLLTRTRRISRVVTSLFDDELRSHGINAPQFSMLVLISRLECPSRAEIARENHQERSTSTRNLQLLLSEGWIEEVPAATNGRRRPIRVSSAGKAILAEAMPAWRSAQTKARTLLGEDGASAITALEHRLPNER